MLALPTTRSGRVCNRRAILSWSSCKSRRSSLPKVGCTNSQACILSMLPSTAMAVQAVITIHTPVLSQLSNIKCNRSCRVADHVLGKGSTRTRQHRLLHPSNVSCLRSPRLQRLHQHLLQHSTHLTLVAIPIWLCFTPPYSRKRRISHRCRRLPPLPMVGTAQVQAGTQCQVIFTTLNSIHRRADRAQVVTTLSLASNSTALHIRETPQRGAVSVAALVAVTARSA
jgi:hypothetical protein